MSVLLFRGVHLPKVRVQAIEPSFPDLAVAFHPHSDVLQGPGLDAAMTELRLVATGNEPGAFEDAQVLETAGMVMSNGSANSVTEHSPVRSRARMALRVGSASAANVLLR